MLSNLRVIDECLAWRKLIVADDGPFIIEIIVLTSRSSTTHVF